MTKDDALLYLKILSREFDVPMPGLKWTEKNRRGYFAWHKRVIRMGPKAWRSPEACLVHEFAHAVTFHRHGSRVHHGREFQEALEQVARYFYGDPKKYCWNSEYETVRNYARRVGLL